MTAESVCGYDCMFWFFIGVVVFFNLGLFILVKIFLDKDEK